MNLSPPLTPRNGHTLKVILPGRVSDPRPGKQNKEQSLGDQQDIQQRWLKQHTDLPVEVAVVAGSGSGELLEREEYLRLQRLVESDEFDLVLTEDLGRIVRRVSAYHFCELCEDHNVRLIAINNHNVDTANPGWRDAAFFNAYFYEKDNRDKSERLKERLRSRFLAGGALERPIFGYVDPPGGAKHDSERRKDPDAESVYDEWFRLLEIGNNDREASYNYEDIADWLNKQGTPTGLFCRSEKWTGTMVGKCTHNPILKGTRRRNVRKTKRVNATGKYVSRKADPDDLLTRDCPHLAFLEPRRYDRVIRLLKERNTKYRRRGKNGRDTRSNVPKKRTRFPGQMIECGLCGRGYVFGGHGQTDHLMCDGARGYGCWNGVTVDGPLASEKITAAVLAEIEALPGFDEMFLQMVNAEANRLDAEDEKSRHEHERQIRRLSRELDRLIQFLREGRTSRRVEDEIARLEEEQAAHERSLEELEAKPRSAVEVPPIEEIKSLARAVISEVAADGMELKRVMQGLIPKIVVFPYRLCDGGKLVLRAYFRLHVSNLLDVGRVREVLEQPLERILCVDLFDSPQREEFRQRVVHMRQPDEHGRKTAERKIACVLGITVTAAQRAAALQRTMDQCGLTDAYIRVTEPPEDCRKLRRHKHPRYKFDPLPHAGQL